MKKPTIAAICVGVIALPLRSVGQITPITGVQTYYQASQPTGNVSYVNSSKVVNFGSYSGTSTQNDLVLQNFTAGGQTYGMSSLIPSTVKFRRVDNANVTGNRTILFFEHNMDKYTSLGYTSATIPSSPELYLKSSFFNDMEEAFTGRYVNRGSDNILGNANEGFGNFNNIERVDVIYNVGQAVFANNGNGLVIFERGTPSNHGAIKIALILSLNGLNEPDSFSNIVSVSNSSWGATDVITGSNYCAMRSSSTAQAPYFMERAFDNIDNQGIGGIFIPYSQFGLSISSTPTVYGYALMAGDVTATNSAQIMDFTNATYFPTNTDAGNNSIGGMDLIGVSGSYEENSLVLVNLSGNVFHDGNGLSDGQINGPGINLLSGQQLYINLFHPNSGMIIASVPVNANGSWSIPNIERNTIYNLSLSTTQGTVGSFNPGASLPSGWGHTAEWGGTQVPNSTPSNPQGDGFYQVIVNLTDVQNISFGVEETPVAQQQAYVLPSTPSLNSVLILNDTSASGNPGPLSGNDAEDGPKGTGSSFIIATVPSQHQLWYNGAQIVGPDTIFNYNPALLEIHFTTPGAYNVSFNYAVLDSAGISSPLATYSVSFPGVILPVTLNDFNVHKSGKNAILTWQSSNEINLSRYVVEHSYGGKEFTRLGSVAVSNLNSPHASYSYLHENISSGYHYYRLRMEDNDGSVEYSTVKSVNFNSKPFIELIPNPFVDYIAVKGISKGDIVLVKDILGTTLYKSKVNGPAPNLDLGHLPSGMYLLLIQSDNGEVNYSGKIIKR